jgi:GINS complex subunit 3
MPRYYDIDSILAEEELIPCTTLFDFSYLAHLDPDSAPMQAHQLSEGSRIKMPLWGVHKWAMMGFVRLSLPRHFQRKSRERIEAEPAEVDLR